MSGFALLPRGPFSLAASTRFLKGFAPAAEGGDDHVLRLGFVADPAFRRGGRERVAGVALRAESERAVGEVGGGAAPGTVRAQAARIRSLDVAGRGFPAVGAGDPVIGRLRARHPGPRPVLFCSPYEAAAWAPIGGRIRITRAARIKAPLARELGGAAGVAGVTERAFPGPSQLGHLASFPGLSDRKVGFLRELARAATTGVLDATSPRSRTAAEALGTLRALPGIGPFGAEMVLPRGAGAPDLMPAREPRLARAVALASGLDGPPPAAEPVAMAEARRPYRTWVALLLRTYLEEETGEIRGRPPSRPAADRSRAGPPPTPAAASNAIARPNGHFRDKTNGAGAW